MESKLDAALSILHIIGSTGGTELQQETRENALRLINDFIKGDIK